MRIFTLLICFSVITSGLCAESYKERLEDLKRLAKEAGESVSSVEDGVSYQTLIDFMVAGWFLDYIAWEIKHPEIMKEALASAFYYKIGEVESDEVGAQRYHAMLEHELKATKVLLERVIEQCKFPQFLYGGAQNWSGMQLKDGYFRLQDRPVFPGGFNMIRKSFVDPKQYPQWKKRSEEDLREFIQQMKFVGVGVVEQGLGIPALIKKDGSIDEEMIQKIARLIQGYTDQGLKVDVLCHWGGNEEVLESLWPGITHASGNGVAIDIDHPAAKELVKKVSDKLMPELKKLPGLIAIDMANEPFFGFSQWSEHSLARYREWLNQRHQDIHTLNKLWHTNYDSFDAIPMPVSRELRPCSPGEWYDRITFHNYRVSSFFEYYQDQIRKEMPEMAIHVKAQDNSSLGPMAKSVQHGINREHMTRFVSMHGVDTRPLPQTEPRMAAPSYDASPYSFHWLGQSFLYDYFKSLEPNRPIVDFEYHAFSINAIRVPEINPKHASSTLWLAHMHGMIGNMVWYWHRRYGPNPFEKKHFQVWFHASLSTQPLLAAEYFRTMAKLNHYSREIEALATVKKKPVRLLVSKASYYQNTKHIDALHRAYEGLCFHGIPISFVTEEQLSDGFPADCQMLIIPDVQYLEKDTLIALEAASNAGVSMLRYGEVVPEFDPYGRPLPSCCKTFFNNLPHLTYAPAAELSERFYPHIARFKKDLAVRVVAQKGVGTFGLMRRQAEVNGKTVVLVTNVSNEAKTIQLYKDWSHAKAQSLLDNGMLASEWTLEPQDVLLLKVE